MPKFLNEVIENSNTEVAEKKPDISEQKFQIPEHLLTDSEVVGYISEASQLSHYNWAIQGIDLNDSTILDMGCGRSDFNEFLKSQNVNYKYIGVDKNNVLIEVAKTKYAGVDVRLQDWHELKIQDYLQENISWGFNLFGVSYQYTNINDRLKYLKDAIEVALTICSVGVVFLLLSEDNEENDSNYLKYKVSEVCKVLEELNEDRYGIDNTLSNDSFKLVIFK